MNRPLLLCGAGAAFAVASLSVGQLRGSGCTGCAAPSPPPAVVSTHVVTQTQCAVLELQLDSGVTKTICLTADQLEKAMENQP